MGRGEHCTDYQRHIIQRMAAAGIERKTIEFVMERSRTFVVNAIRTNETRKSPGRPRKTTAEEDRKIVIISKKHPFSSAPEIQSRLKLPEDLDQLFDKMQEVWKNIPPKTIRKLIRSMRKRMIDVIVADGNKIKN